MTDTFDVAVIGGGPAGIATALAARDRGLAVILVERSDFTEIRVGEHLDAEALPLLAALGIPLSIWQEGHLSCASVLSIWGQDAQEETHALFHPFGEGRILSRPRFDQELALLAERRGVVVRRRTGLIRTVREDDAFRLTLEHGGARGSCTAAFVVDATGRGAGVARDLGSRRIAYDRLAGIAAFVEPRGGEHNQSICVEASEDGWWYSAPLADGRRVLTYMTDADLIVGPPRAVWSRALARSVYVRELGGVHETPSRVFVRSACSQRLTFAGGDGWLAVGDAAMSFDPLSSAGIRKGLKWGFHAAEIIHAYRGGDAEAPARYVDEVHAAFALYLQQQVDYYRIEQRWATSRFWSRRHRAMPAEIPITLGPDMLVGAFGAAQRRAWARITEELPQIDLERLRALSAEPRTAAEIVARYCEPLGCLVLDRDVIIALQMLNV